MSMEQFEEVDDKGFSLRKKILAKCCSETVNRVVHAELRKLVIEKEQTVTKAPMLLANPTCFHVIGENGEPLPRD